MQPAAENANVSWDVAVQIAAEPLAAAIPIADTRQVHGPVVVL